MAPRSTAPGLAPVPAQAKQLVVFLHGYGADGNDLIEIGRQWQRWLPDAAFVAPHAPELLPGSPMGRQWFALTFRDPHERWRGVNNAAPGLDAFLDEELQRHKLAAVKARARRLQPGHDDGAARRAAPAEPLAGDRRLFRACWCWRRARGRRASRRRCARSRRSCSSTATATRSSRSTRSSSRPTRSRRPRCRVEWHLSVGVGHGIDGEALRHGGLFLTRAFGLPYPR